MKKGEKIIFREFPRENAWTLLTFWRTGLLDWRAATQHFRIRCVLHVIQLQAHLMVYRTYSRLFAIPIKVGCWVCKPLQCVSGLTLAYLQYLSKSVVTWRASDFFNATAVLNCTRRLGGANYLELVWHKFYSTVLLILVPPYCRLSSAGCPLYVVPVNSISTEGIYQCGSVRSSAGCRYR